MQRGAVLALLASAVVVVGANEPMHCLEDAECHERKCGVLFHSKFNPDKYSMPEYYVATGCLLQVPVFWPDHGERYTDFLLGIRRWYDNEANGFKCAYHEHMEMILCYCETENCNTVERREELARTLGAGGGPTACLDTDKNRIVCGGKCGFVADFAHPNASRIERGCNDDLYDIEGFRHLQESPLEDYGYGYACTSSSSGQILCVCSGYNCNSNYELALIHLIDDYHRSRLQKDVETTIEQALVTTLSPSEPIGADESEPIQADESEPMRARESESDELAGSESVPPSAQLSHAHSHAFMIVALLALVVAVLVAVCFFSQQIRSRNFVMPLVFKRSPSRLSV